MRRIRCILLASDFSSASRPAFARALGLAKSARTALTVVHVMSPVVPMMGDGYMSPQLIDEITRRGRAYAQKEFTKLLTKARKAGVRAAKSRRADMIVMGTHGRGPVAKFFLGSVAGRVVATASCPVLTVRGR